MCKIIYLRDSDVISYTKALEKSHINRKDVNTIQFYKKSLRGSHKARLLGYVRVIG